VGTQPVKSGDARADVRGNLGVDEIDEKLLDVANSEPAHLAVEPGREVWYRAIG
jgi:hypothetical protein